MDGIITMQKMRYINSLSRVSKINTSKCFTYNNVIVFAVPKFALAKAIGPGAKNIKTLNEIFGKRVRVVAEPKGRQDLEKFVKSIVEPVQFNSIEEKENEFILTAGSRNKASLIGRNRRRFIELNQILEDFFGKGLRIV